MRHEFHGSRFPAPLRVPHREDISGVRVEVHAASDALPVGLERVETGELAAGARHLQANGSLVANEDEAGGHHALHVGR